jgi:hypothetical protein
MINKIVLASAAIASCLLLGACDINQDSLLKDDAYTQHVNIQGRWTVLYNGDVTIEQDPDGAVNVFGHASGTKSHPDIKVSGEGVIFKVFAAHNVKADDGTTAQVYYSHMVKAGHHSHVNAYNCAQVVGAFDAEVVPHGHTSITMLSAPKAPATDPVPASAVAPKQ